MFHLLAAGEGERGAGVPVEQEPDRLGQELRVRGVTSVDGDVQCVIVTVEPGQEPTVAPGLLRRRHDLGGGDVEIGEEEQDLGGRGEPQRRAEHEVDHRGDPHADGEAGQYGDRQSVSRHHRGHRQDDDRHLDGPLHPPAEVRQGGGGHGHRRRHPRHRKAQVEAVRGLGDGPTPVGSEEDGEADAQEPGRGTGQHGVADHLDAARHEHQHDHDDDQTEGSDPRQAGHDPLDALGNRRDHVDQGLLARGVDRGEPAHEGDDEGDPDAEGVAATTAALAVTHRGEQDRLPGPAGPAARRPRRPVVVTEGAPQWWRWAHTTVPDPGSFLGHGT